MGSKLSARIEWLTRLLDTPGQDVRCIEQHIDDLNYLMEGHSAPLCGTKRPYREYPIDCQPCWRAKQRIAKSIRIARRHSQAVTY